MLKKNKKVIILGIILLVIILLVLLFAGKKGGGATDIEPRNDRDNVSTDSGLSGQLSESTDLSEIATDLERTFELNPNKFSL